MKRCTPIACNNPTLYLGLCADCFQYAIELELALWGPAPTSDPLGVGSAEERVAEQFEEPHVVHVPK